MSMRTDSSPSSASESMRAVRAAVGSIHAFNERAALKLVEEPLRRLKADSTENQIAFVFEALQQMPTAESFQLQLALKGITASLLRNGLTLNSLEAVRL